MAELLISKGADVNVLSHAGETPLDGAIAFEQLEIADLLRKYGNKTVE
ncbi:MAG: ankyrin repeat domain-containing protein [Verrucomicrobia bacterium]|nr:ankyrin repeat domain-containing protein [Verrucomicrobiota bacterium]